MPDTVVCLLLEDSRWSREFRVFIQNTGFDLSRIEVVDKVPARRRDILSRFPAVLVVDALFCGSVEVTAEMVRDLRAVGFNKPIVVLDEQEHEERVHPVLSAGANYRVPRGPTHWMAANLAELLDLLAPPPSLQLVQAEAAQPSQQPGLFH